MNFCQWVSTETFDTLVLDTKDTVVSCELALLKGLDELSDFILVTGLENDLRSIIFWVFFWWKWHELILNDSFEQENNFFPEILHLLIFLTRLCGWWLDTTDQIVYIENNCFLCDFIHIILGCVIVYFDIVGNGLKFLEIVQFVHFDTFLEVKVGLCSLLFRL